MHSDPSRGGTTVIYLHISPVRAEVWAAMVKQRGCFHGGDEGGGDDH